MKFVTSIAIVAAAGLAAPLQTASGQAATTTAASAVVGQSSTSAPSKKVADDGRSVADVIKRVNAANEALISWSASFAERRHFVHFDYSETRSGSIVFNRELGLRLAIDEPSSEIVVITRTEARMFEPRTNQLHIYRLEGELSADRLPIPVLLGRGDWEPTRDHTVAVIESADREVVLELIPTDEGSTYQRKTLWLNPDTWLPVRVQLVESTDDVVHFVFSNVVRDAKIDPDSFRLTTPDDVEVMEHTDLPKF